MRWPAWPMHALPHPGMPVSAPMPAGVHAGKPMPLSMHVSDLVGMHAPLPPGGYANDHVNGGPAGPTPPDPICCLLQ
jgi:hypothetical protein